MKLLVLAVIAGCHPTQRAPVLEKRCTPREACWPGTAAWDELRARVGGRLEVPRAPCAGRSAAACAALLGNPFALSDSSGGTQSSGWLDAWTATPSAYAVAARDANDVAAAILRARASAARRGPRYRA
jgi:hypothetical protein